MSIQGRQDLSIVLTCGVLLLPAFLHAGVDTAWVRRYDGPAHADDVATKLVVDSVGNVYVAGYSAGVGTGDDFVTIKY